MSPTPERIKKRSVKLRKWLTEEIQSSSSSWAKGGYDHHFVDTRGRMITRWTLTFVLIVVAVCFINLIYTLNN